MQGMGQGHPWCSFCKYKKFALHMQAGKKDLKVKKGEGEDMLKR